MGLRIAIPALVIIAGAVSATTFLTLRHTGTTHTLLLGKKASGQVTPVRSIAEDYEPEWH